MGQQRRKETVASPPPRGRVGGKATVESTATKKRGGATSTSVMVQLPVTSVAPSSLAPPWQRCRDNAALVAEQLMPIMETAQAALVAIQTTSPPAALAEVVGTQLAVCTEFIERPNLDRRVTTNKLAATTLLEGIQTLLVSTVGSTALTDRVRKQLTQVCTDLVPFEMTDRDRKHACAAIKRRKGAASAPIVSSSSSSSAAATLSRSRRAPASASAAAAQVPSRRYAVVPTSPVAMPTSPVAHDSSSATDVADSDSDDSDDDGEDFHDDDEEEGNDVEHEAAEMAGLHDSGSESYDNDDDDDATFEDSDSFIATDPAASDSDSDDEFSSTDSFRGSTEDLRTFFEMGPHLTMSDSMTEDHAYGFMIGRSIIPRDALMDTVVHPAYAPLSRQNSNASSFAANIFVRHPGGRFDSPLRLPSLSESNPFLLSLSATPDDHMSF